MKKVYYILGIASVIIMGCMLYLAQKGVVLKTEPLIKPAAIDAQFKSVSFGVIHRLFPNFQTAKYVIWGIGPATADESNILGLLQAEHFQKLGKLPTILQIDDSTKMEDLQNCAMPCWLLVEKDKASELPMNPRLSAIRQALGENYISITILEFERDMPVPEICETEKRLEFDCILPTSVREVRRRFKDDAIRYFFMRRYNDKDHFLFLQRP